MADYATSAQLANWYGQGNINRWADMEGTGDANASIATRTSEALTLATDRIDARLRLAAVIDRDVQLSSVPNIVMHICRVIAGFYLSKARDAKGYDDQGTPISPYYIEYMDALSTLEDIATGKLKPAADW